MDWHNASGAADRLNASVSKCLAFFRRRFESDSEIGLRFGQTWAEEGIVSPILTVDLMNRSAGVDRGRSQAPADPLPAPRARRALAQPQQRRKHPCCRQPN